MTIVLLQVMSISNLVIHFKETQELEENSMSDSGVIFRLTLKKYWVSFMVVVFATVVSIPSQCLTQASFVFTVWSFCVLPLGLLHAADFKSSDDPGVP